MDRPAGAGGTRAGCIGSVSRARGPGCLHCADAASAISFATASGCDVITTCDAPLTTTVFTDFARSAMKAKAAGGMFLSALP